MPTHIDQTLHATLCYLINKRRKCVILALKLQKIAKGKISSYGGKFEKQESVIECVRREVFTESGLLVDPRKLKRAGIIRFYNIDIDGKVILYLVHVFVSTRWEGVAHSTTEMGSPRWYSFGDIPYEKMMVGDFFFLPPILQGDKIVAEIKYRPDEQLAEPVKIRRIGRWR